LFAVSQSITIVISRLIEFRVFPDYCRSELKLFHQLSKSWIW